MTRRSAAYDSSPGTTLITFVRDLGSMMGWRSLLAALLIGITSIAEGFALLLLVPLLQALGLDGDGGMPGRASVPISALLRLGDPPRLEAALAAFALVACVQALLFRWQSQVTYALEHEYVARWRARLYRAVISAKWAFLAHRRTSDIAHVLTTDLQKTGIAAYQLMSLATAATLALVYLALALWLSPVVTAIALAAAVVPIAIGWRRLAMTARRGDSVVTANAAVHAAAIEHLAGAKTAKSYGAEGRNEQMFVGLAHGVANANAEMLRSHTNERALVQIGSAVLLALVIFVGARGMAIPGADLLVLLLVFARLLPRLTALHGGVQNLVALLPSYGAAARLLDQCAAASEAPTSETRPLPFARTLQLDQVSFTYPGTAVAAVRDVTLTIRAGATTGLAGPSGSGKTTLADIVLGLLDPQAGRVLVDGAALDHEGLDSWRSQIGYVAQDTFLFHDTVRANLEWAHPGASEHDLWEALRSAAAEAFVRALPAQLDTVLGDRGVRLSGGERQRLALARAFLRRPRLLILDEATSALDSENEQVILDALAAQRRHITVVLITHRLGMLKDADVIHVIDEGRVVESGTWASLRSRDGGRLWSLARAQGVD